MLQTFERGVQACDVAAGRLLRVAGRQLAGDRGDLAGMLEQVARRPQQTRGALARRRRDVFARRDPGPRQDVVRRQLAQRSLELLAVKDLPLEQTFALLEQADLAQLVEIADGLPREFLCREHVGVQPAHLVETLRLGLLVEIAHGVAAEQRDPELVAQRAPRLLQLERGRGMALLPEPVDHFSESAPRAARCGGGQIAEHEIEGAPKRRS